MDTQRTALVSSNADKTPMSLFPSEVVGSLFRNKNKGRSHFVVHPHYKGSACKQVSKCIHRHQSLLPTWTQPVPLSLESLSPSLRVRQIPALCTLAKGGKIPAPLAMKHNLHLQSHSQPAAINSPLALSVSLPGGRGYSPSLHTSDRHRAQELRLSFQLVTADTGVSLQGGVSILGSQLWSHFYWPSLDHPTGTLESRLIPWS